MNLIKNKQAWKKWIKDNGLNYQESSPLEPVQYPCFAYTTLRSFGYEELNENYLYVVNLKEMLIALSEAK